jgi:hypothetical protein
VFFVLEVKPMSTSAISPAAAASAAAAAPAAGKTAVAAATKATAASVQANLIRAALQEATETAAQTLKEANSGDRQAQKLLTKTAAAARPVVNTSGQLTGTIVNLKA